MPGYDERVVITYEHEYDYSTQNADGTWSEPVVRYSNSHGTLDEAERRHALCKDVEHVWDREFEGIYGYRWQNCRLVKRTSIRIEKVEPLDD